MLHHENRIKAEENAYAPAMGSAWTCDDVAGHRSPYSLVSELSDFKSFLFCFFIRSVLLSRSHIQKEKIVDSNSVVTYNLFREVSINLVPLST